MSSTATTTHEHTKAPSQDAQGADLPASQVESGPNPPATQQEAVKRSYAEATTALRETHRDEFNADVKARVQAFGFDWSPRPTPAERAKAEIARLMAETGLKVADL